jgi:hypothetical protein
VEFLRIDSDQTISIDFISSFQKLQHLQLIGKFDDLSPIGNCKSLSSIVLQCTVEQLNFVKEIPIEYLLIDNCNVNCDLDVLNVRTLKMLELLSIAKLEDICLPLPQPLENKKSTVWVLFPENQIIMCSIRFNSLNWTT